MTKNNKKLVQAWIANKQHDELVKIANSLRRTKASIAEEAIEMYIDSKNGYVPTGNYFNGAIIGDEPKQNPKSTVDEFLKGVKIDNKSI